jgi:hypothetical protein
MNEIVESPFASQLPAQADTSGSRQLQQRESAETLAMVAMAHRFPRNVIANTDKILNAFTRTTLAEKAAYQFAKGGSDVSGPARRRTPARRLSAFAPFGVTRTSRRRPLKAGRRRSRAPAGSPPPPPPAAKPARLPEEGRRLEEGNRGWQG